MVRDPEPLPTPPRRSHRAPLLLAAIAVLIAALAVAFGREPAPPPTPEPIAVTGTSMSTAYTVKIVPAPDRSIDPAALQALVQANLDRVEALMSRYRAEAELSRFNRHRDTTPLRMSPETLRVLNLASSVSEKTGGAFDVTVAPLVTAWGFNVKRHPVHAPDEATLAALKARVGWRNLIIDERSGTARKLLPDLDVDLSAIAKGFGVDQVATALERAGHLRFMVEVGGEVRARGHNARGEPWRIAIEKPDDTERSVYEVVPISDLAVATSGDYRNYYELDGRRISHTIDPRTAFPIDHGLASVSVILDTCALADAWATGLNVLGPIDGPRLAEREGLAAFFLIRNTQGGFDEHATGTWRRLVPKREKQK